MKISYSWIILLIAALFVLGGYFLPVPFLQESRTLILNWAVTLSGVAALVGIVNLLNVHSLRIREEKPGWFNSLVVILGFAASFLLGMFFKPSSAFFQRMVSSIQFPIEASLLAVLSITLAVAIIRAIRPGMNRASLLFILIVLVFLWAATGFVPFEQGRAVQPILTFLNTLQIGGARGILIGVGLGALTTGIRALLGRDIPAEK